MLNAQLTDHLRVSVVFRSSVRVRQRMRSTREPPLAPLLARTASNAPSRLQRDPGLLGVPLLGLHHKLRRRATHASRRAPPCRWSFLQNSFISQAASACVERRTGLATLLPFVPHNYCECTTTCVHPHVKACEEYHSFYSYTKSQLHNENPGRILRLARHLARLNRRPRAFRGESLRSLAAFGARACRASARYPA